MFDSTTFRKVKTHSDPVANPSLRTFEKPRATASQKPSRRFKATFLQHAFGLAAAILTFHAAPIWAATKTGVATAAVSAPQIVVQPQSVVVPGGQPTIFRVGVAATTTGATYQWFRNGAPIPGETSATYVFPAVRLYDSGASYMVKVTNSAGTVQSAVARLTVNAVAPRQATAARPFSDQSPWNVRPTHFVLGTAQVPTSSYFPSIASGAYSVAAAIASPTDLPMTVMGPTNGSGIWVPDAEVRQAQIVIPHWPANVTPASGSDGHADIVDVPGNKIHSFWQLQNVNGQWRAAQYAWTALDGRGWGTPGQYMQGARAAGVPTIGGLIRLAELNDGLPTFRHALAMSLTFNALSATPAHVFPATSSDNNASSTNSGSIPEGALIMLPQSFDVSQITDPMLKKVVQTLKSYGAYVVDRNYGTPFAIYVENGSNFNLMSNGWSNTTASQLDLIRAALRPVAQVSLWVDANGAFFTPATNLNLLSMRGYWYMSQGATAGVFDTMQQAVVFPDNGVFTTQVNAGGRSMPTMPRPGQRVKLTVSGTNGASFKLDLKTGSSTVVTSGLMADGATLSFVWPTGTIVPWVTVTSGPQGGGKISATANILNN